jgi:hypothetical protein
MAVDADWLAQYEQVQRAVLAAVETAVPPSAYDLDIDKTPGEYVTTGVDIVPRGPELLPIHLVADAGGLTLFVAEFPAIEDAPWREVNAFTGHAVEIVTALISGQGKQSIRKLGPLVLGKRITVRIEGRELLIGQIGVTSKYLPVAPWEEKPLSAWA